MNKRDGVKYCNISDALERCPFYDNNKPRPFYSIANHIVDNYKNEELVFALKSIL